MLILRWDGQSLSESPDELAEEEPLEIRVRGRAISVTMRTPGYDEELAVGFLLTEGIIHSPADVLRVELCPRNADGNVVDVLLGPLVHVDFERLTRHVFASSSCGLCGKATIEAVHTQFPPIPSDLTGAEIHKNTWTKEDGQPRAHTCPSSLSIFPEIIASLPGTMRSAQATFDRTGGLHAAALFDTSGKLIVLREDVGRHNAVDKVIGHCFQTSLFPLDRHILLVSGRSSFEIMQKALAARIPVVAAISAPSSLAATFARESGQTLIGFLRGERMNIYAHPQRIAFPDRESRQRLLAYESASSSVSTD